MKYRPINENDKLLIEKWISLDTDHLNCPVDFWTAPNDGRVECFAVEDDKGAIFYCRAENVLRLHIQFAPPTEKRRTVVAVDKFAEQIRNYAKAKYKQIVFESISKPLIEFLKKRGYIASPNEWKIEL